MKIDNIKSYILCTGGLIVLIIIALCLPNMIFAIQDGYRSATVESENRESFGVLADSETYPMDIKTRMQRVAQTRWGDMTVSVVEQAIDQEQFNTVMTQVMSQEYMTILLSLADVELLEALEGISVENVKVYDRYVVYGADYTQGILLDFWYINVYLPSVESYVEFIVDSESYSIYYAELEAAESVSYVVYLLEDSDAENVEINLIYEAETAEKKEADTIKEEEQAMMIQNISDEIPNYYIDYYSQYYGISPEEILFAMDYYDELVTVIDDFVTVTYTLPYGENSKNSSLLFRFDAHFDAGEVINVSIGLPVIRQLIRE